MENNSTYDNFGVRQYDDILGRFMSIDPLWYEQLNWSPYHYCGNNPVNGRDPEVKKLKYIGDEKEKNEIKNMIQIIKLSDD